MSKSGNEMSRELENFVNGCSQSEKEEFVKGFLRMHPTLMQLSFGLMLKCVEAMANKAYVDGRNQASKETALKIIKGFKEQTINELINNDPYWTKEKAEKHVNADYFKLSSLPLV